MPPLIQLQRIERTSPTLWTHMRLCGLRAALAATKAADEWVLHDPRLWLGTAFHEVMRASRQASSPFDPSAVWNSAIERHIQRGIIRSIADTLHRNAGHHIFLSGSDASHSHRKFHNAQHPRSPRKDAAKQDPRSAEPSGDSKSSAVCSSEGPTTMTERQSLNTNRPSLTPRGQLRS